MAAARETGRVWLMAAVAAVVLALAVDYAVYRVLFAHPAHDQSWLLYAARQVLDGAVLYGPRITESNPPLIVWLNLLPAWLGGALWFTPMRWLEVLTVALAMSSTAWCVRLLRAADAVRGPLATWLAAAGILAVEMALGDTDFAQKEQLLIGLALPYMLYRAASARQGPARRGLTWGERVALGVVAGVGVCLKPQQMLLVVGLELVLLVALRRRWLQLEAIALALVPGAYLSAVAVFTPQYLTNTVPLLRDTYWAYGTGRFLPLLINSPGYDAGFLLALTGALLGRRRLRAPIAPFALLAASAGAAVAYALQGNGWNYHFYPQKALLACALGWLGLEALLRTELPRRLQYAALGAGLAIAACLLPVACRTGRRQFAGQATETIEIKQAFAALAPGTPVYFFSTNLVGFADVTDRGLVWGSRYAHLWLVPAIVRNEQADAERTAAGKRLQPARVAVLAALQRRTSTEDLARWKPAVVLVKRCSPADPCQGLEDLDFDLLAWFMQSPEFAAQWRAYRRMPSGGGYAVFVRQPGPVL